MNFLGPIRIQPVAMLNAGGPGAALPDRGAYDLNNPTGTRGLIAVDKVGGKVRFYDPRTFHEIDAIEVEKLPHEVAISADHKTAYVAIYGPGIFGNNPTPAQTIVVIDLESRKAVDQISVAPEPTVSTPSTMAGTGSTTAATTGTAGTGG